jgi:hypothetical protein
MKRGYNIIKDSTICVYWEGRDPCLTTAPCSKYKDRFCYGRGLYFNPLEKCYETCSSYKPYVLILDKRSRELYK